MKDSMNFPLTHQGVRNLDQVRGRILPVSGGPAPREQDGINVGPVERSLSVLAGGLLAGYGMTQKPVLGLALFLAAGSLLIRGLSGHCQLYDALGVSTANSSPRVSNKEFVYRYS